MNPIKLAELKASRILDKEVEEDADGGEAWKQWILSNDAEAPSEGDVFWVDYRTGNVDW